MPNDKHNGSSLHSLEAEQISESQANVMFVTADNKSEIKELEALNLVSGEQVLNLCSPFVVGQI